MKRFLIGAAVALAVASTAAAQFNTAPAPDGPAAVNVPGVSAVGTPTYLVQPKVAGGGFIDVGQAFSEAVAPIINSIVSALIATAMGWLFYLLRKKLNINIDGELRASLTAAAQRQASSLIADGEVKMVGTKVAVGNKALADAVNTVFAAAPEAAARFGLTADKIADRIVDMVPQVPAGASIVAAAHGAPSPAATDGGKAVA